MLHTRHNTDGNRVVIFWYWYMWWLLCINWGSASRHGCSVIKTAPQHLIYAFCVPYATLEERDHWRRNIFLWSRHSPQHSELQGMLRSLKFMGAETRSTCIWMSTEGAFHILQPLPFHLCHFSVEMFWESHGSNVLPLCGYKCICRWYITFPPFCINW